MGKLETPPEGDKGQLPSSPSDPIEPTVPPAGSVLPPVQSQPTSTLGETPQPGPSSDHMTSETSQFDSGTHSIPAVAFPPLARIPEINTVPSNQHVTNVTPQPNDMPNMVAGGVSGVTMGQIPGMTTSSSVRQEPMVLVPAVGGPWRSGLFDCFQDPNNGKFLSYAGWVCALLCILIYMLHKLSATELSLFSSFLAAVITTVAPCVTFGQIAEIVDNGSTSCVTGGMLYLVLVVVVCHWNIGFRYRQRIRKAYNLSETPVTDRLAHIYFPACALCQEFRELKHRGLDPFLGNSA
ncbi:hypothetical protein HHK36_014124 [Tetracentron sinense]|uniref:Uncharacterized protein n=1 Tax=Tetracentron sinense TaxID=13715 RepID=A0A834ZEF4_TETSI|nr:hypothetical protein HHK36_014124 [Tetracentron sinense]